MLLSDTACKQAKPRDKDYKMTDGEGMYLLVKKSGKKYWRMNYRYGGKSKTLAIGIYPEISLKVAREKRLEARRLLKDGVDPSKQKQLEKLEREASGEDTFAAVFAEWHEKKCEEWTVSTSKKVQSVFERDLLPFLGNYPLKDVTPLMLLGALRKIEGRGAYDAASDARSYAGFVFRYGIATGRAERDVAADLKGALKTRRVQHNAYLEEEELGEFLRLLDEDDADVQSINALKLLILTFVRTSEIRGCCWSEIDFENAVWRIPAERMKMAKDHIVPLSRQAVELLRSIRDKADLEFEYVFPNSRSKKKMMSENSMLYCVYRLGYKGKTTVHGFRSSASTILNESGLFRADVIERQLAHVDGNTTRSSYNRAIYLDERREMMQWWADRLDQIRQKT